jgi:hypothetical protein
MLLVWEPLARRLGGITSHKKNKVDKKEESGREWDLRVYLL